MKEMDRGNRIQQQRAHKTRYRNLGIYFHCKQHSENGQVKRGIFAQLAREENLTRERIRVIFEMMRLEMEGDNVETR